MRPLHALLLVVALVVVAGLSFFLLEGGTLDTRPADAVSHEELTARQEAARNAADLAAPDQVADTGSDEERSVARVEPGQDTEPESTGAERAGDLLLTGRLVDEAGRGIPEATVIVTEGSLFVVDLISLASSDRMPWIRRAQARTDADGSFEIDHPGGVEIVLAARAPGFAPLQTTETLPADRSHDLGEVALEQSIVLSGHVLDEHDVPVEGVELRNVSTLGGLQLTVGNARGVVLATTDAQGAFEINELASGPYRVLVHSEAHPSELLEGETERPGDRRDSIVVRLQAGAEISGVVSGAPEDEELVVRALEVVDGDGALQREPVGRVRARFADVQPDGRFRLRGLTPDKSYSLTLREKDESQLNPSRGDSVTARAGDTGVEIAYLAETALVFQVKDAATGLPVEEFGVQAGTRWLAPHVDEDGKRITRHPGGHVRFAGFNQAFGDKARVRLSAVGYEPFDRKDIQLVPGDETNLGVLLLDPAPVLTVRVIDGRTSEPVAGAEVSVHKEPKPRSASGPGRTLSVSLGDVDDDMEALNRGFAYGGRTDSMGRVRLAGYPGLEGRIRVTHDDYAPTLSRKLVFSEGAQSEEIKLGRGGTVVIETVDASGEPLAGIDVDHEAPDVLSQELLDLSLTADDTTDVEGRLVFKNLSVGEHRFRIGDGQRDGVFASEDGGAVFRMRSSVTLNGAPAEDEEWQTALVTEGGHVVLQLVGKPQCELVGRITEDGAALAGAEVELREKSPRGQAAAAVHAGFGGGGGIKDKTSGSGEYAVRDVKVGEYELVVRHPSRVMPASFELTLEEGENEFSVDLPVGVIEGHVRDEEGDPIEGVTISAERVTPAAGGVRTRATMIMVTDSGGSMVTTTGGGATDVLTDAEGFYRLRGVETNADLVVKASGADTQPAESRPLQIAPGEVRGGIDFDMKAGGSIAVSVTRADGSTGSMCMVRADRVGAPEGGAPKIQMTDGRGKARLRGLEPGRWRVSVTPFGGGPANVGGTAPFEEEYEVTAGETTDVEADLP